MNVYIYLLDCQSIYSTGYTIEMVLHINLQCKICLQLFTLFTVVFLATYLLSILDMIISYHI